MLEKKLFGNQAKTWILQTAMRWITINISPSNAFEKALFIRKTFFQNVLNGALGFNIQTQSLVIELAVGSIITKL